MKTVFHGFRPSGAHGSYTVTFKNSDVNSVFSNLTEKYFCRYETG